MTKIRKENADEATSILQEVDAGCMLVAARPKASKDSVVLEFQAMLKRECFHHKNVAYYASAQRLTPRYFTTIIREMTGKSASYWITQAVTVEAQHLMLDKRNRI